jgi:hypothetical protein
MEMHVHLILQVQNVKLEIHGLEQLVFLMELAVVKLVAIGMESLAQPLLQATITVKFVQVLNTGMELNVNL